jgi:Pyrimidine dimer DNA glycosylase
VRLWSLHPKYLDARGLVALWREALLAQAVLRGRTRGYRHHPQLARFEDVGDYEWEHLMRKLRTRDPARAQLLRGVRRPQAHPLFRVVAGPLEPWEKV